MNRDEFVDMLMAEYEKTQKIKQLNEQRRVEEDALAQDYKVVECNQKRNALVNKYSELMKAI